MLRRPLVGRLTSVCLAVLTIACGLQSLEAQIRELLPDIVVRASDLADNDLIEIDATDRRLLRFANGTGNFGEGKLFLQGVLPRVSADTQAVSQRVFSSDGTFRDREAGVFVFHPGHSHVHIEEWARYRLREFLVNEGVGEVIAESDKVSFCILDLTLGQPDLPNAARRPEFTSCSSTTQGLSVGWVDIYSKNLPGQSIDVTDVPDGLYWLESEVDPENHILESNEDNNIARSVVAIGHVTEFPDPFEPNDTAATVLELPPGQPSSANLGPCNPLRKVGPLNAHSATDRDLFAFYVPSNGTPNTFVRIDFSAADGDLDLVLRDRSGKEVARAANEDGGTERIDFSAIGPGWYLAEVVTEEGDTHSGYALTVVPPSNQPPSVDILLPAEGNTDRIHSAEGFVVSWEHSDPEGNEAWVTLYVNDVRALTGDEVRIPTSVLTSADVGLTVINSADIEPGTYWVYAEITDGGSTSGSWSAGTVTFHSFAEDCEEPAALLDCNQNGIQDACEIERGLLEDCDTDGTADVCGVSPDRDDDGIPDACQKPRFRRGDSNHDGVVDIGDAVHVLGALFLGGVFPTCLEAANANDDSDLDVSDGLTILNHLFLGGAVIAPPGRECGRDPDPGVEGRDLGCEVYLFCS